MTTAITTYYLLSMIILVLPLISKTVHKKLKLETSVKMAFLLSTMPTILMMKNSIKSVSIHLPFINISPMDITITITINQYSTLFMPTALLVTWSIVEFSPWYLKKTKLTKNFTKLLLIFLIAMMILSSAGSLFQLLVGWEGVGIMSFLLINWWFSRSNANSSALQAIIYNRIGDIGLILAMSLLAMDLTSWNIQLITSTNTKTTLMTTGLILAAVGKSAQFSMHLWLPAAMEGPTPVSALLHSSTMVVAGVYLLAQLHPMLDQTLSTTMCLYLGVTTSIYAATSALTQNDIKKIIAFSTSSQLGLMMTAIGMNQPNLAIFHMISHATFKATLFLAAGSTIHNTQNEQDIRKMASTKTTLPITSMTLTTNGLALSGLPFLSGFYSKDTIIETMMASNLNAWALLATLISTTMTSAYTMRMIVTTTTKSPAHKPMMLFSELDKAQISPLMRLTLTTIILGPMLTALMLNTPHPTISTTMKLTPLLTIMLGVYLSMESMHSHIKINQQHTTIKLLNCLAFFKILHRSAPKYTLNSGYLLSHQLTDLLWLEKSGPKMLDMINTQQSKTASTQKGLMKNYLMLLLLTVLIAVSNMIT